MLRKRRRLGCSGVVQTLTIQRMGSAGYPVQLSYVGWPSFSFEYLQEAHSNKICNFSPEAKGKELLPGCNEGQSPALYFLQNNSHGTSRAFFPLFSTSLNFYRYSAVKSFTHSHVS